MVLVFVALVVVFSKYRSGSTREYTAVFTSASALKSGLVGGDRLASRWARCRMSLNRDNQAVLKFTVADKYSVPKSVKALIRYENLTGDRYHGTAPRTRCGRAAPGRRRADSGGADAAALDLDNLSSAGSSRCCAV